MQQEDHKAARPKEVSLRPDGIHIEWNDGHQGYFRHRFLRGHCPCAGCVHEMTGKRMIGVKEVAANIEAVDYMTVGRYALQFLWSDSHDTGIFTFVLLRTLCQCDEHLAARAQA